MSILHLNIDEFGYIPIRPNVENTNIALESGEIIALIGASGSGKTTLLKLAAGLLELDKGKLNHNFNRQAYLFQETRLLPWKSCLDNITLSLMPTKININLATQYAKQMGLTEEDLVKYPSELSGGMRQRVALARAFIIQPDLLFLDEPFSALDFTLRAEMQQLLLSQMHESNMAILMVTHDLNEAILMADEILVLGGDPVHIVKSILVTQPRNERDPEFVFFETQKLMQMPEVVASFVIRDE
ncbi:MAG: ABC transporter ATP-binding protein [Alphaproteobacteria bacterium]|nr:ABC transporter ATP-binding protein [Alphaproteobacteria bacterium]